jgi:hypothetical protein
MHVWSHVINLYFEFAPMLNRDWFGNKPWVITEHGCPAPILKKMSKNFENFFKNVQKT